MREVVWFFFFPLLLGFCFFNNLNWASVTFTVENHKPFPAVVDHTGLGGEWGAAGVEGELGEQWGRSPPTCGFGFFLCCWLLISSPVQTKLSPALRCRKKNLVLEKTYASHSPGVGRAKESRGLRFLLNGIYLPCYFLVWDQDDFLSNMSLHTDRIFDTDAFLQTPI